MIIFFSCLDYITFKNLDLEFVQNRFFCLLFSSAWIIKINHDYINEATEGNGVKFLELSIDVV